jgi:superoxide dismutase, Cu-Zn family
MNKTQVIAGYVLLLAACATTESEGPAVTATVRPASSSQVSGTVKFTQVLSRVRVDARLGGLAPGAHGFHIHENGDCSAPDAMSAGGHFNPYGKKHGGPDAAIHHAGDFGNLTADQYGKAALTVWLEGISVSTGKDGVIGRSIVVHADPDDLKTDPTGNSGGRVGCGVIR